MSLAVKGLIQALPGFMGQASQKLVPAIPTHAGSVRRPYYTDNPNIFYKRPILCENPGSLSASGTNQVFQRSMATKIDPPLRGEEFFNREREISALSEMLNEKPQLSIISGPVNSGKTSLLLYLLEKISAENNRPVLHLNLRERSFVTVNEFQLSLEKEMEGWLNKFKDVAKKLQLKVEGYNFTLQTSVPNNQLTDSIERLDALFETVSKQLPPWNWWTEKQSPILFIDEANKLHTLLKDKQGHEALFNLFEWLVMNTKEKQRFHVLLGTSDSFFHLWVNKFIGSSRWASYVIGDLTKEEAEKFWKEKVITRLSPAKKFPPPPFEDAYQVCGGNMFLLDKYFSEHSRSVGTLKPIGFSLVGAERAKLVNAFFRNGSASHPSHTENGNPQWNQEQLITMMKKLIASKNGFLDYEEFCKEMGRNVVDAFISYNLLHLRPTKRYTHDLPEAPEEQAILTPETPSSLLAMKGFLKWIEKDKV